MDFSQSVYHLWKQFRRFGREGGAPDPMQQGPGAQPGAIGGHDRLQLKVCHQLLVTRELLRQDQKHTVQSVDAISGALQ